MQSQGHDVRSGHDVREAMIRASEARRQQLVVIVMGFNRYLSRPVKLTRLSARTA
jgi:hypothetical protein